MQRGFAYDMIYFTTDLQWFITQQFMLILSYEIAESRLRNIMSQNLNGDTSQLGEKYVPPHDKSLRCACHG